MSEKCGCKVIKAHYEPNLCKVWNDRYIPASIIYCPLHAAAQEMQNKLQGLADWLDRLAADSFGKGGDSRFPAFADACRKDGENYRATARDIKATIAKSKG